MSKRAAFYDRCRTYYVEEGYSVRAIAKMVNKNHPDAPTRRTIQNWKDDGNWEEKRQKFVEQTEDLFELTREVAMLAGKNAVENPSNENFNSFARMLATLKYKEVIRDFESIPDEQNGNSKSKAEKMQELKTQIEEVMGA